MVGYSTRGRLFQQVIGVAGRVDVARAMIERIHLLLLETVDQFDGHPDRDDIDAFWVDLELSEKSAPVNHSAEAVPTKRARLRMQASLLHS